MTLQLEYRPDDFDSFYGSESTIEAVHSKLKEDPPHTYLITGPSGCGKTTLGRIIAQYLGAIDEGEEPGDSLDYRELDTADFRGIDTIRNIRRNMQSYPATHEVRVYLLDECHQLSKDAQEALLKALEDTPPHVYFILCTTDPEKLKITLRRRCTHFVLSPLNDEEARELLEGVIEAEEKRVPESILDQIIEHADGSPGVALAMLDKIIDLDSKSMKKEIDKYEQNQKAAIDLCRALIKKTNWKTIAKILQGVKDNEDPERVRRAVMGYCASILLKEDNGRAFLIMDAFSTPTYDNGFHDIVLAAYSSLYAE